MLDPTASSKSLPTNEEEGSVKCVIWDLDDTVWNGTLSEDQTVTLREEIAEVIRTLDQRGILHSIASRNDHAPAMEQLAAFGLEEYFLYPQIHWGSKAESVGRISELLNLGIDAFAFVDDQPFERDEVKHAHPAIRTVDARVAANLTDQPAFTPRFITPESAKRRQMYQSEMKRQDIQASFERPKEAFLETLDMTFTIKSATESDLKRAEELTVRTNQLNATGYTYGYEELDAFRRSDTHQLLVTRLDDVYGTYGTIGLALVETNSTRWRLKLLLMSCRVMSRGVGSILMSHILQQAKKAGVVMEAEFVPTDRNRQMYITYKFSGFKEAERTGDHVLLRHDLDRIQAHPPFVDVRVER